ncbi:hypothetical protein JDV02_002082 [Purpureocillium takamizusanense]|uniref:Uncharacterized protein n=1 Tax=Purpureocillium takamizusanense TaxID=2060973 RepID=A0A9Q8V887_9HYPO|nr:uncharacterized protein JDV02_002082 [Purpureocillium takamizusanense]UNI15557.1 hypothetical protein JDV02_002082 [Purpureocillium takamizusanense]
MGGQTTPRPNITPKQLATYHRSLPKMLSFIVDAPHLILHIHLGDGGFRVTDSSDSIGFYQEQWDKDLINSPQLTVHSICENDSDGDGDGATAVAPPAAAAGAAAAGDKAKEPPAAVVLVPLARVSWSLPLSSVITTYNLRSKMRLHMFREVPFSICHTVQGPLATWHWKRLEASCAPHLRLVDACGGKMMAALVYRRPCDRRYRAGHLATLKIAASTPPDVIDDIVVTALAKLTYQRIHWYYCINKTKPRIADIAGAAAG